MKVSREEYIKKLTEEYLKISDGGTEYRKKLMKDTLNVALSIKDFESLLKGNLYQNLVKLKPELDEERVTEIHKLLQVVYKRIYSNKILDQDALEYVRKKMEDCSFELKME